MYSFIKKNQDNRLSTYLCSFRENAENALNDFQFLHLYMYINFDIDM